MTNRFGNNRPPLDTPEGQALNEYEIRKRAGAVTGRMTHRDEDVVGTILFDAAKAVVENGAKNVVFSNCRVVSNEAYEALKAAVSLAQRKVEKTEKSS